MERKRLANRLLTGIWIFLFLLVVGLFLGSRLTEVKGWLRGLVREPQAVMNSFQPRSMAGFRCSFEQPGDTGIWVTHQTALAVTDLDLPGARHWARVTYYPGTSPGLLWTDESMGVMDWRGVKALEFDAYNPNGWSVDLKIKIKDQSGNSFQRAQKLAPGRTTSISVPLSAASGQLNLGRVSYLNLFLWGPGSETVLFFSNFSLPGVGETPPASNRQPGLKFLGLEFPRILRRGEIVEASFFFMPEAALPEGCLLLVRLKNRAGITPLGEVSPPLPTSAWAPGRMARVGPFPLEIPMTASPGLYELEAVMARPLGESGEGGVVFLPYANADLPGHSVAEVEVIE